MVRGMWCVLAAVAAFASGLDSGMGCRVNTGHQALKTCSVEQLVEQMKENPTDSKVIGHSSDAMALMVQKSAEKCANAGELGAIAAILKAMDTFETDMWVQRYACALVGSLISGHEGCPQSNRDILRESGAQERVERALANGASDHYIQGYCTESLSAVTLGAAYRTPEPSEEYRQARLKNRRDEQLDRMAKRASREEV
jgi:hypothetical protein|eukprot:COSAG02_NODE_5_length_66751_cov_63.939148_54_plen_199_part_00